MFTYKNKKTGAVINTHGNVTGANWQLVKAEKKATTRKNPEKPAETGEGKAEEGQE